MPDLLNKLWPFQQLLVAWCVPNNHRCSLHEMTYYTVPTAKCSDVVTKKELIFNTPLLHTDQRIGDTRQHQRNLTITSHRVMVTYLVKALIIYGKCGQVICCLFMYNKQYGPISACLYKYTGWVVL